MILYSVAFYLSMKEYFYSNLSSHSSLAKMSYLSDISYQKIEQLPLFDYNFEKLVPVELIFQGCYLASSRAEVANHRDRT